MSVLSRIWSCILDTFYAIFLFWNIIFNTFQNISPTDGGTGMIASSSTFRPHPGRVIRDLFRQLHAVRHGTEALVYSHHPKEAAASSYLSIIMIMFGRIASGIPWFLLNCGVNVSVWHQVSHGRWMTLPFVLLLWGLYDSRIAELRGMLRSFSIKLHFENPSLRPSGLVWGEIP